MKKIVAFSTVLIVLSLAIVLVFAQSNKTDELTSEKNAAKAKKIRIEFFYHGDNNSEKSFVDSQTLLLKKKYSQKLVIAASDLDSMSATDSILDQELLVGSTNVICVLNKKYYLVNMDSIADKITKYIDFILDPNKHQNPMLADLLSEKIENNMKLDA